MRHNPCVEQVVWEDAITVVKSKTRGFESAVIDIPMLPAVLPLIFELLESLQGSLRGLRRIFLFLDYGPRQE